MKTKVQKNIDLLRLVLMVTVATGVVTFLNVFYASYQVQRTQLVDATLESNYNYAQKLASSTEDYLQAAQQQLKVSAQLIGSIYNDATLLEKEAERLRTQTDSFNSVV
ncbi:MAG TPA: diguanylate cyclase, partial [Paenalcaligenes hominis]|nr:diguanylate cyclase [Paenalcaligenes hominis]